MGRKKVKETIEALRGCIEEEKDLYVRVPVWVATSAMAILENAYPEPPIKFQSRNECQYECAECERPIKYRQRYCDYCGKRLDWNEL